MAWTPPKTWSINQGRPVNEDDLNLHLRDNLAYLKGRAGQVDIEDDWTTTGDAAVGTATLDASAALEVSSTTKGALLPRMTTAQKNAISSPATGLVVYDTTLGAFSHYNGSVWGTIGTSDHTALTNLAWTSGAHTGTALRLAAFDAGGAATEIDYSGDWLSIYTLAAGRTGTTNDTVLSSDADGTLYGSAASGGDLILQSSSHATVGRVGIHTSDPQQVLDVDGSTNVAANFRRSNSSTSVVTTMHVTNPDTTTNNWAGHILVSEDTGGTERTGAGLFCQFTGRSASNVTGDLVAFTTNAGSFKEWWRITSAGKMRIQGSTPTTQIADFSVSATGSLVIDLTAGNETDQYIDLRPEDNQWGVVLRESDGTGTAAYANFFVVDSSPDYLSINVTGATTTSALNINSDDEVGIGIAAASAKLHVRDDSGGQETPQQWDVTSSSDWLRVKNATGTNGIFSPALWSNVSSTTSLASMYLIAEVGTDTGSEPAMVFDSRRSSAVISTRPLFQWRSYGSSNTYMTIDAGGNVGIGDTSPGSALVVEHVNNSQLVLNDPVSTGRVGMAYSCGGTQRMTIDVNGVSSTYLASFNNKYGAISFSTGTGGSSTERWRFLSGGQANLSGTLAVGQTSMGSAPTAQLDVFGDSVRIRNSQSPTSGGTGVAGEIAWDGSYLYVCTATNTWARVAITGGY